MGISLHSIILCILCFTADLGLVINNFKNTLIITRIILINNCLHGWIEAATISRVPEKENK